MTSQSPSQKDLIGMEKNHHLENYKVKSVENDKNDDSSSTFVSWDDTETTDIFLNSKNGSGNNNINRFRSNPFGFMMRLAGEGSAFYSGSGWRAFHHYIGQRLFYPGYTVQIKDTLENNANIQSVISKMAVTKFRQYYASLSVRQRRKLKLDDSEGKSNVYIKNVPDKQYEKMIEKFRKECEHSFEKMMQYMIAEFDSVFKIKIMAFFTNFLLTRCYNQGIHIRETEYLMLRKYAIYAQKHQLSLIFLPCHKSHIDYLVMSSLISRLGIALPHIAAGDNLQLPGIGYILKHSGAFFIRRNWNDDNLYNALMKEYVELLLTKGYNLEVFVEGTRSRVGKVLQPKFGFIKLILDAVMSGRVKDALIVPVSIGYDKVIETSTYVNELLGTPKEKESLLQVMYNFNILSWKLGRIDIRFAKPYSLKEYIMDQVKSRGSNFDPVKRHEDRNLILRSFGYRVLSDINSVSVAMPTALVGTILLTLRGRGVGQNELVRKVNWLKGEILEKSGRVAHFGGMTTKQVVLRAVDNLKDLVGKRNALLEPVYYPIKRFELSFYRNQIIYLFITEALFALSIYADIKRGGAEGSSRCQLYPTLLGNVKFISRLLKSEFVYGPGGLEKNFSLTVKRLVKKGVFSLGEDKSIIKDFEPTHNSKQWIVISQEERRKGRETFDFYCFLVWPFVETYWLVSASLFSILPDYLFCKEGEDINNEPTQPELDTLEWVEEKILMERIQIFARTMYYEGDLNYFESINKETIKNALLHYVQDDIVLMIKSTEIPSSNVFHHVYKEDIDRYKDIQELEPETRSSFPLDFDSNGKSSKKPAYSTSGKHTWYAVHPNWIPKKKFPTVDFEENSTILKKKHSKSSKPKYPSSIYDTYVHKALISRLSVPPLEEEETKSSHSSQNNSPKSVDATVYPLLPQSKDKVVKAAQILASNDEAIKSASKTNLEKQSIPSPIGDHDNAREYYRNQVKYMEQLLSKSDDSLDLRPLPENENKLDLRPFSDLEITNDPYYASWADIQPEGKLWQLCEFIGKFRREGKNRRDTATVANRVLRLAVLSRLVGESNNFISSVLDSKKSKTDKKNSDILRKSSSNDSGSGSNGSTGGSTYVVNTSDSSSPKSTNDPLMITKLNQEYTVIGTSYHDYVPDIIDSNPMCLTQNQHLNELSLLHKESSLLLDSANKKSIDILYDNPQKLEKHLVEESKPSLVPSDAEIKKILPILQTSVGDFSYNEEEENSSFVNNITFLEEELPFTAKL